MLDDFFEIEDKYEEQVSAFSWFLKSHRNKQ